MRSPPLKRAAIYRRMMPSIFRRSYRFQRSIEARIRLMDATGRHELPESDRELAKLAYLLGLCESAGAGGGGGAYVR